MKLSEAFKQLDLINESVNTDEFKQLLVDINQLSREIHELRTKKQDSWNNNYSKKLESVLAELSQLKDELQALKKSYSEYSHTERDDDGDRYYYRDVFVDNPEKKAAAAEEEAKLTAKIKELEDRYEKIKAEVTAEAEKDETSLALQDKTAILKNKKDHKETIFQAIVEEEQKELVKLVNKIRKYVNVDTTKIQIKDHNMLVLLESEPIEYEASYEDFDSDGWGDSENYYFIEDRVIETVEEDHSWDFFENVARGLGFIDQEIDNMELSDNTETLLDIPNSSWKLSNSIHAEITKEPKWSVQDSHPATRWEPAWGGLEIDDPYGKAVLYIQLVKTLN